MPPVGLLFWRREVCHGGRLMWCRSVLQWWVPSGCVDVGCCWSAGVFGMPLFYVDLDCNDDDDILGECAKSQ